jgi:hypothetical protein
LTDGFLQARVEVRCPETYSEFWSDRNMTDVKKMYKSKTRDSWRAEYAKYSQAQSFQAHEQPKNHEKTIKNALIGARFRRKKILT